jgi:hypothetical protein
MPINPETLYRELGRLIETMPELGFDPQPSDRLWLGRAYALVAECGDLADAVAFKAATRQLNYAAWQAGVREIHTIIYRAFAVAEMNAPAGAAGAFIPVGNSFDAYAAISRLLQTATNDVLIVDPYMDETALTDFGVAVPEGVRMRLLADQSSYRPSLQPAAHRWVAQHGAIRPLEARLAPPRTLHDRAIFIDQTTAWTLTQSLKDFARRSPAEIVRADDTAALKIAAYQEIWSSAEVVV